MTVSAESYARYTIRSGIWIGMTCIAYRTLSIVPDAFFIIHKTKIVCLWVSPFNSVIVKMALDTNRITALYVVARLTGFYVLPG